MGVPQGQRLLRSSEKLVLNLCCFRDYYLLLLTTEITTYCDHSGFRFLPTASISVTTTATIDSYHQNLKSETSLNALTDDDIKAIWLPLIVYDNTDQKEVTRLGMDWEWATGVTVTREGNFTRSGIEEVDEAEIFEGAENRLTMNQTYTWEFQCKYKLERYPFDTQVNQHVLSTLPFALPSGMQD